MHPPISTLQTVQFGPDSYSPVTLFRIDPDSNEEDELEAFSDIDGDSNGHIDMAEMQRWLYPSDYDPAETEFHHLLTEADTDMDGRLSKDEILENYHVLLESEATRWGAMGHEELQFKMNL